MMKITYCRSYRTLSLGAAMVAAIFMRPAIAADDGAKIDTAKIENAETDSAKAGTDGVWKFGGAIRLRYDYASYATPKYNRANFDVIRLESSYDSSSWFGAAQWRFYGDAYPYAYTKHIGDINFPVFGWVGYKFDTKQSVVAGLNQVPFGLQPYVGSTFYQSIANIVGLEDVHNLGVKYHYQDGPVEAHLAYYVGDGGQWHGTTRDGDRYSVNVVNADDYVTGGSNNKERDLWVARGAYTFKHSTISQSEVGASLMHSTLHNKDTGGDGGRNVYALHYAGKFGGFGLMAEAARQLMSPKNPSATGNQTVTFGAFDGSFNVAAKGTMYSVDLSYDIPWKWGYISGVKPYINYSTYVKDQSGFKNTDRNIAGIQFAAGPFYIYTEMRWGRNDPYTGDYTNGAGAGGDDKWKRVFYANIGYYF